MEEVLVRASFGNTAPFFPHRTPVTYNTSSVACGRQLPLKGKVPTKEADEEGRGTARRRWWDSKRLGALMP